MGLKLTTVNHDRQTAEEFYSRDVSNGIPAYIF